MDAAVLATHIAILQEELVCALGCTEPIAVAYAATLARAARPSETAPPTGNGIGRLRAAIIGRISEQYRGLANSLCQSFACARYFTIIILTEDSHVNQKDGAHQHFYERPSHQLTR